MLKRDVLSELSSAIRFRVNELSLTLVVVTSELHAQSPSFEPVHLVALATKQQSKIKMTSDLARSKTPCRSDHTTVAPPFGFARQILLLGRCLL
jgi:hypothetical protein